jgi:hypothetical protein
MFSASGDDELSYLLISLISIAVVPIQINVMRAGDGIRARDLSIMSRTLQPG